MSQFPPVGGRPLPLDEAESYKPGYEALYRVLLREFPTVPFGCKRR